MNLSVADFRGSRGRGQRIEVVHKLIADRRVGAERERQLSVGTGQAARAQKEITAERMQLVKDPQGHTLGGGVAVGRLR